MVAVLVGTGFPLIKKTILQQHFPHFVFKKTHSQDMYQFRNTFVKFNTYKEFSVGGTLEDSETKS